MIVFREIKDNCPWNWKPGIHTYVEHFPDDYDSSHPSGTAYITDLGELGVHIDGVLVADDCRRQGVATKLVKACLDRWPNIEMVGTSDAGRALLNSLGIKPASTWLEEDWDAVRD